MQRIAYILGTSHIYQRADKSCEPGAVAAFLQYLQSLLNTHGIKAIGEEASTSANAEHGIADTISAKFASKHGIPHRYCDPSPEVSQALGIVHYAYVKNQARIDNLSADQLELRLWKEDLKREPYWLTTIEAWDKERDLWPLLFIYLRAIPRTEFPSVAYYGRNRSSYCPPQLVAERFSRSDAKYAKHFAVNISLTLRHHQKSRHLVVAFAAEVVAQINKLPHFVGDEGDFHGFAGDAVSAHVEIRHGEAMHEIGRSQYHGNTLPLFDAQFTWDKRKFSSDHLDAQHLLLRP
jgi:hypothetical protein